MIFFWRWHSFYFFSSFVISQLLSTQLTSELIVFLLPGARILSHFFASLTYTNLLKCTKVFTSATSRVSMYTSSASYHHRCFSHSESPRLTLNCLCLPHCISSVFWRGDMSVLFKTVSPSPRNVLNS